MKPSVLLLTATLVVLTFGATEARADLATYTETVTGSGSFDGASFTDAMVTLMLTGDTADITAAGGVFSLVGPATVSVEGLGSDSFTDEVQVVSNQNAQLAGFGDNTEDLGILFTRSAAFATYDLSAPFGPITGVPNLNSSASFATVGGTFQLDSASGNSEFSATAAVPEPGSLLLLATAAGMAFWGIKSKATA